MSLCFLAEGFVAPAITPVGPYATLDGFLRALYEGRATLPAWPWRASPRGESRDDGDERAALGGWLRAQTHAVIAFAHEAHLLQCVRHPAPGEVTAHYLFDAVYARAHPQALDAEHVAILHGTLAAKLLDEGEVLLDDAGLAASLRWAGLDRRGVRLTRAGGRDRV